MIDDYLSEIESRRFGLPIYRISIQTSTLSHELISAIDSVMHGMVILRAPAGSQTHTQLLQAGIHSCYADTIVYYGRSTIPLANTSHQTGQFAARAATQKDAAAAAIVAIRAFSNYRSHYSISPHVFPEEQVRAGYAEWAENLVLASLTSESGPCYVSVDTHSNEVNGFIASNLREDGKLDIVLNAVSPQVQGKGIYASLLRHVVYDASQAGLPLTISTQVWNLKPQRAWTRAGFLPESAYETFHIARGNTLHPAGSHPRDQDST